MERKRQLRYTSAQSILANGHEHLHSDYSSKLERALGKGLPQMEVHVKNLTLSVNLTVSKQSNERTHEIPTIGTVFKHAFAGKKKAKQQITKPILHNFSGVFEPGTMTLVLGQPGSGKSSLLKVLSGRFPYDKTTKMEGEITYNGVPQAELNKRLPQFVSYVPQRDRHFPTLTVKETLAFAHECCGSELSSRDEAHFTQGSAEENKAALEAARAMYRHYPEIVTQQLGLEHCQDTIVGDSMVRGVSGGERKRVTTGEMEFGNKFVTLMDEISTGLDSAATFDIVKTQRSVARKLRKTVVMALLQPSPEVFDLFDNVLILNDGYVMYHGPREQALPYFRSLGFVCPPTRDVAEFLLDIGTAKQDQYVCSEHTASLFPHSAEAFANLFCESTVFAQTKSRLAFMMIEAADNFVQDFGDVPEFHQSFLASTWTILKRELRVTWRNKALIKGRAVVLLVIGFIFSSLFYQLDVKNPQAVLGAMFPSILFFTLGQSANIPRFVAAREVFYKQRSANFYRTSSYVLAAALNQIPIATIESVIFSMAEYWACGFVADAGAFLTFVLVLVVTNLAFAAWFFLVSSVAPNIHVAEPLSMLSLLLFYLFAGFINTHEDIPVYFQWVYWINPVAWSMRSLAINQYGNQNFDTYEYDGYDYQRLFNKTMGVYSLESYDIYTDRIWIWLGVAFMLGSFVLYMGLSCLALENLRYDSVNTTAAQATQESDELADDMCIDMTEVKDPYTSVVTPRVHGTEGSTTTSEPFVPVTLAFKDLRYSVPNPANKKESIELLKGISGFAKPGSITALMGSSGAGKTTLMDVIAGRKTGGKIEGQILLNGYPATDLAIRRSTGYCEQMDFHTDATTFREALVFSAFLRQGADVPDATKYDTVEEVLDLLDLRPIADKIVRGSSMEQMKRLTIGVELAAQPSVLFLDEPTSGLDARSAKLIMDGVRKVANTGRTVVCTIHQPSWEVFQVFDSLLLLKKGGETVYFGELGRDASELIAYFESIEGVSKLVEGYNPATWMLEVIGAGVGNTAGQDTDFVHIFNASQKRVKLEKQLNVQGMTTPAPGVAAIEFGSKRAASEFTQAKFLIRRFNQVYWRTPSYNLTRFVTFLVLGLVFGLSFTKVQYDTFSGINAGYGMMFLSSMFLGAVSFKSVKALMFELRESFYRERASQTYNAFWWFMGTSIAEIPYVVLSTLLFCSVFFPLVGFSGYLAFVQYWLHLSLLVLVFNYIGQFLAFILPTLEVSATIGTMMIAIFFLFSGFIPPASQMPAGYKWLHAITPTKYSMSILASVVFGNCENADDVACQGVRGLPPTLAQNLTVAKYVDEVFYANFDDVWVNAVMVAGFVVVFRVLALIALRYVSHLKR